MTDAFNDSNACDVCNVCNRCSDGFVVKPIINSNITPTLAVYYLFFANGFIASIPFIAYNGLTINSGLPSCESNGAHSLSLSLFLHSGLKTSFVTQLLYNTKYCLI